MFKQIEHEFNKYSGMHYLIDDIHKYEHSFTKLYKYGMILLGVDSFKQGEARRIIEFFCNKGFILINYRIKCLNRTQTENLFLPTSSCVKCEDLKWWMIQDAANLGAFCGIIFYHENSTMEENCLRRLNAFKGKSCPLKNTEGVVRYDFAAINVCLNLIHIPDTYGDFFKDSSPFYTVKEISKLLSDTPHMFEGDELFHLSLYEENAEVYHFETTLYKLKMFLAYTLADQNKVGKLIKHYQIQYQAHQTLSQREERRQLFINGINDELIMLAELSEEYLKQVKSTEDIQLVEVLIYDFNLLRLLKILTTPQLYKTYDKDIFKELEVYGVKINDFEKLIISTSLIQFK